MNLILGFSGDFRGIGAKIWSRFYAIEESISIRCPIDHVHVGQSRRSIWRLIEIFGLCPDLTLVKIFGVFRVIGAKIWNNFYAIKYIFNMESHFFTFFIISMGHTKPTKKTLKINDFLIIKWMKSINRSIGPIQGAPQHCGLVIVRRVGRHRGPFPHRVQTLHAQKAVDELWNIGRKLMKVGKNEYFPLINF